MIRRIEASLVIDQIDPGVGRPLNHAAGTVENAELDVESDFGLNGNALHCLNGQTPMVKTPWVAHPDRVPRLYEVERKRHRHIQCHVYAPQLEDVNGPSPPSAKCGNGSGNQSC